MIDVNHLCPGCMGLWEDTGKPCPRCGFSWEMAPAGGRELPVFTILAGRYLLGRRIGVGGFGITYLAMDLAEERVTAIKEFFPSSLASREGLEVAALPGEEGRYFREALRSFHKEADLLSRFADVPGIVRYRDYVMENGTAYLVMDYIEGTNLRRYMRETGKTFTQEEALGLMRPILLAVDAMHRKNVLHRDISPENLILKPDGTLTLIDFGAAREFSLDEEENLTVILKHGYAPEEQYHSGSRQGPWTDLYACCAVLYQMVSGIQPQDATARARKDDLMTLDEIEGVQVTEKFARIIEKGMTIHATERCASIRALMAELYGSEGQTEKCPAKTAEAAAIEKAFLMNAQAAEHQGEALPEQETCTHTEESSGTSVNADIESRLYTPSHREKNEHWAEQKEKPEKKYFLIAGVVLILFFVIASLLLWPEQYSAENAETEDFGEYESEEGGSVYEYAGETDGLVWLMTGQTDASYDTPVQYLYEYNERGYYSRIISYGISAQNYASVLGGSVGIDASFGEIVSEFSYEYDEAGRIVSGSQAADTGESYDTQFVYEDEKGEIPAELRVSSPYGDGDMEIELDESGYMTKARVRDGSEDITMFFEYSGGPCTVTARIYCLNPEAEAVLSEFLNTYVPVSDEISGVEYETVEDPAYGERIVGTPLEPVEVNENDMSSVYAEVSEELGPDFEAQTRITSASSFYRAVSPRSSGEKDEYGNVLEHNGMTYSYAEYEVKDGIYTPTGRTSGTLPEIAGEMQGDNSENDTGGTEEISSENTASFADTGKQEEVLELLERYGIDYMTVDEVREEYPDDSEAYIAAALQSGELMSLVGCRITTLEGLAPGLYAVLPPEEWFLDDGTEAWTILTADMRTCWEISEALLEEGYYAEGGKAWGFFGQLSDTGADAEGNGLIVQENDQLRFEIYAQYLEYWGERTGKDWSITNPDTGETVSKNE